jgi:hypothetical protein
MIVGKFKKYIYKIKNKKDVFRQDNISLKQDITKKIMPG